MADIVPAGSDGGAGRDGLVIDLPQEEFAEVVRHARASRLSVEEYALQAIQIHLGLSPARLVVERGPAL